MPEPGLLPRLHTANRHKYGSVQIKTVRGRKGNTWITQKEYQTKFIQNTSTKPSSTQVKYSKKLIHNYFIQSKTIYYPQASLHLPLSCLD